MTSARRFVSAALGLLAAASVQAADPVSFTVKMLTPETALKAAQAALAKCRAEGAQVAVTVVDRSGVTQVVLRDRLAGAHTIEMSQRKAWTAISFRTSTSDIERESRPGAPSAGIRHLSQVAAVAGGVPIEAGGSTFGAIGISGAPTPAMDDACAKAGIKAIADSLEF
jgi:uncharacterized protein GlcG (DUF336 family)